VFIPLFSALQDLRSGPLADIQRPGRPGASQRRIRPLPTRSTLSSLPSSHTSPTSTLQTRGRKRTCAMW
jgi:hypothetical protein